MRSKLSRRFYEPIILEKALIEICLENVERTPSQTLEATVDARTSSEEAFRCFVNKLGQLCDSRRKGATVTAFTILQLPEKVQYRFASNKRTDEELEKTIEYVTDILNILANYNESQNDLTESKILWKAMSFVKHRARTYFTLLVSALDNGIRACDDSSNPPCKHLLIYNPIVQNGNTN